jgi:hypothetical protein
MCLPRSLHPPTERTAAMSSNAAVADYLTALRSPMREVAERLVAVIDAELPQSEGVVWHGHPVWRLGGEPAVLVKAYPKHVTLGFWRGQAIASDGALTPGTREMASVKVSGAVDPEHVAGWLRQAAALHPAG